MIDIEEEVGALTSRRRAEGERKLLLALLMDSVRCLFGEVGGPPTIRARLATEARAWIEKRHDAAPYSFENVCAWLELPAERLRRCLLERLASRGSPVPALGLDGSSRPPAALEHGLRGERNARIKELRAAGWKPRDIARRFGLTYGSILLICVEDHGDDIDEAERGGVVSDD
jgi:hypothetical protein